MPDLVPGTREPWAKGWALSMPSVRWQEGLSCLSGRPWADHQVGGGGSSRVTAELEEPQQGRLVQRGRDAEGN